MTQELGHLITGKTRARGKVVDEWSFHSPFGHKSPKLTVSVSIEKQDATGIAFVARCPALRDPIVDTDISELHHKVETALQRHHDVVTCVTREDCLEVVVSGCREGKSHLSRVNSELRITYQRIKPACIPQPAMPIVSTRTVSPYRFPYQRRQESETLVMTPPLTFRASVRDETLNVSFRTCQQLKRTSGRSRTSFHGCRVCAQASLRS